MSIKRSLRAKSKRLGRKFLQKWQKLRPHTVRRSKTPPLCVKLTMASVSIGGREKKKSLSPKKPKQKVGEKRKKATNNHSYWGRGPTHNIVRVLNEKGISFKKSDGKGGKKGKGKGVGKL